MQKILVLITVIYSFLDAFEVNTHQALTRCAITSSCGNGTTQNLHDFVNHGNIKSNSYGNEIFENYSKTYRQYANDGIGFGDWNITINNPNYLGMIEAGSVLEDAVYSQHDHAGDGRFNNHFYAAQFNSKYTCPLTLYMKTSRTLCTGYGIRTDNIDWVFNNSVNLGGNRKNDYGLTDAFYYYKKSFIGSIANRRKYQAKLFVSLGHMVHMLQDLHSPAHCRDNSHSDGDYLEIYGRYNGGFNLRSGAFNSTNNYWIKDGIKKRGSSSYLLANNRYYSYEDFFKKEVTWVGNNFASESHFNFFLDSPNAQTGAGLSINNKYDNVSLFDGRNRHPSKSETFERAVDNYTNWGYIYTEGNTVSNLVKGVIPTNFSTIGLVEHGIIFDRYHMIAPSYEKINGRLRQTGLNQKPLEATAVNVMPRAVASTQAFINFFFRGQMKMSITTEGKVTIKNVSDPSLVSDRSLLTFKNGGKVTFYYYNYVTGKNEPLNNLTYRFADIVVGGYGIVNLKSDFLKKNLAAGTKITVLYEGDIGTNLGGNDSYGIGMKGLSVDVVSLPTITKPDSYSFSVKGRGEYFPNYRNSIANFSFDVDVYNNGVYEKRIKLDNLLKLVWYDGSAHFNNSTMHHYDIWCQGQVQLCNYLRTHVPTNTTFGYEDWIIDWTIWNYGSYTNNGTSFITNIRRQIAQYYTLQYSAQKYKTEELAIANEDASFDWVSNGKDIPLGLKFVETDRIDARVEITESNQTEISHKTEEDTASEDMLREAKEAERAEIEEAAMEEIRSYEPLEENEEIGDF